MKTLQVAVFVLFLVTAGSISAPRDQEGAPPEPMLSFRDYNAIGGLIDSLPQWRHDHAFTDDEWQAYFRLALALQRLPRGEVEHVLVYRLARCPYVSRFRIVLDRPDDPRGKIMILLRVMFELPQEPVEADSLSQTFGIEVASGFKWEPVENQSMDPRSPSFPVSWIPGESPELVGTPPRGGGVRTGHVPEFGQSHNEFRYFAHKYRYRDLEALVDVSFDSWRDLVRAAMMEEVNRRRRDQ